jgi:hypothetical protein
MSALINTVTKLPIVPVPPRDFVNPLATTAKPFRHGIGEGEWDSEYQSLLPPFVNGRLKFMHLGKRYTLLRTGFFDSDDHIIRRRWRRCDGRLAGLAVQEARSQRGTLAGRAQDLLDVPDVPKEAGRADEVGWGLRMRDVISSRTFVRGGSTFLVEMTRRPDGRPPDLDIHQDGEYIGTWGAPRHKYRLVYLKDPYVCAEHFIDGHLKRQAAITPASADK